MSEQKALSRKDIARIVSLDWRRDVSADEVRLNEVNWGIRPYRIDRNSRLVRYKKDESLAALKKFGILKP